MPIRSSVGVRGVNVAGDVMFVQILLNDWRMRNGVGPITVDGIIGPETNGAIRDFQTRFTSSKDGRVDPNGQTIAALEDFHLQGALSGRFADSIRYYRDIYLRRDPVATKQIFQAYLKVLRERLG